MNKIIKKVFVRSSIILTTLVMVFTTLFTNMTTSFAAEHNVSFSYINGWTMQDSNIWGSPVFINVDGEVSFCLQSEAVIAEGPNQEVEFDDIGITEEQKSDLSLIANFGYFKQPSETNYVLTQNLIHSYLGSSAYYSNATYPTQESQQDWRNEVMQQVNAYKTKVSFDNTSCAISDGQTLLLEDLNGVLNTMEIVTSGDLNVSINNNTLEISGMDNTKDNSAIVLKKAILNEGTNFVVRNGNSQAVSVLKTTNPLSCGVTIYRALPHLGTLATGINGEKEFDTNVDNTIIDTSKEYTLVTELIHKETGEVVISKEQNQITFQNSSGEYVVTLQIPAHTLESSEYYFAEYLYEAGKEHGLDNSIVEHNDSNDKDQTVYFNNYQKGTLANGIN
ncbi:MAG: hypothetical protein ACK5LC_05950 [Coprobacillaceae bacterium]